LQSKALKQRRKIIFPSPYLLRFIPDLIMKYHIQIVSRLSFFYFPIVLVFFSTVLSSKKSSRPLHFTFSEIENLNIMFVFEFADENLLQIFSRDYLRSITNQYHVILSCQRLYQAILTSLCYELALPPGTRVPITKIPTR
jgi:hypothetical protein